MQQLSDEYPDVVLPLLAELVKGDSEPLAARAAEMLGAASMMMDHEVYGAPNAPMENPVLEYEMRRHQLIFSTLRDAVQDERASVREPIATVLTSQSDEIGLERIAAGHEQQMYSDDEYVRLLSLGSPDSTGKYLIGYLDSTNPELQATVGAYLAESSQYAPVVLEKILLNDAAPLSSRTEVARNIGNIEDLVPLFVSPETPADLYSEALGTYVERKGSNLTPRQLQMFVEGVEKRASDSGTDFGPLLEDLNGLYQRKINE
ncbi:MAG: hypothetical protein JNG89_13875 [Planctomycetaceae bacterium]|nr:hypothetical protein [Planctomycetaceae bacterium]